MNEPVDLSKFETIRDAYLNVIENYIPLCESDIVDFLRPDTFDKYMAFGIKIPRQLIEESKYYILKDKNPLSDTVKRYPYIQLIVAFWIFNKLYELDKDYNFFKEKYSNIDGFQKMLSQYIYDSLYPFDIYGNPAKELHFLDSNQYKLYDIYYVCNQIKKLGGQSFNVKGNNKIMLYSAYDYATVMQYNTHSPSKRKYRLVAECFGVDTRHKTDDECVKIAVREVKKLSKHVGIPKSLGEVGVVEGDIELLSQDAFVDICTGGNPRETSVEDIKKLYKSLI